jgi:hypothetical protein
MPRISWSGNADDQNEPAKLVRQLSSKVAGCHWLVGELRKLSERIVPGAIWQPQDTFHLTRLLGHQPLGALEIRVVAEILVASWSIKPQGESPFVPLKTELDDNAYQAFVKRMRERWTDLPTASKPEDARRGLASIIERAIEQYEARATELEENAESDLVGRDDKLMFDFSAEGEQLRSYELSNGRAMFRSLNELNKLRRAGGRAGSKPRFAAPLIEKEENARTDMRSADPASHPTRRDDRLTGETPVPQWESLTGETPVPQCENLTGETPVPQCESLTGETPVPHDDITTGTMPVTLVDSIKLQDPSAAPVAEDFHLAGPQPVLAADAVEAPSADRRAHIPNLDIEPNDGGGHLAHQRAVLRELAAHSPTPDPRTPLRKIDKVPKPDSRAEINRHPTTTNTWPLKPDELKMTIVRELRRREAEASVPHRLRRKDRRDRRVANKQIEPTNKSLELPFSNPILAPVHPADFSKILAEVHRECEGELK